MSKIKKFAIILITTIFAMIISINSTNASWYIDKEELCYNENLLCVQRRQEIPGAYYNLKYTIEILGDTSTGNGKTVKNKENAKLASILSHKRGTADPNNPYDVAVLPLQNAIWKFFPGWMKTIGSEHEIKNFPTNGPELDRRGDWILSEANNYANNYDKNHKLTDNTDKSKIKVETYTENGENKLRVGPFKYEFSGKLSQIQLATDKNNNVEIKSIEKAINKTTYTKYSKIEDVKSNDEIYLTINMPTDGSKEITKIKVKSKTDEKYVKINFWQSKKYSQQNLIEYEYDTRPLEIENEFKYDIKLFGDLKVIKVDQNNKTIRLSGVGFHIQNKDTGKYVNEKVDGENRVISYVDKDKATVFATDKNGEIYIKNLIVGTYAAYETTNPNYGYVIVNDGAQTEVVVDKTAELEILNKQKYIKLSGYVWVDDVSGKKSERDNLYYNNGEFDSKDTLLDGITVRLMNKRTNKIVKDENGKDMVTKTANGGAYKFIDVLVDELNDYYIEFEYDGLTYENVIPQTNKDNGSKSAEGEKSRTSFNDSFAVVEGKTSNTSITRNSNGNETHTINYTIDNHEAKVDKTKSYYAITANTVETEYNLKDHFTFGQEEIKNINLGLYEREMPDIRLEKDVENVELSINGFHHIYEYGNKNLDSYEVEKDAKDFNVGVKFASKFTETYKRTVYTPDYNYTLANQEKDSKLNVYLTYRIAMFNESTSLKTRINSIVDYFDKNFTIEKIGTGINKETGEITGDISIPQVEQTGDYNKVIIQNNTETNAEEVKNIYVRFKVSDSEVLKAINKEDEKVTYKNIAEVNSYSVYDEKGKVYAGIDKDSAPANTNPGDVNTYEDDTNRAPGMQLDVQGDRSLSGSVFLDESTLKDNERLGDGIYDAIQEHGIEGVLVTLRRDDGTEFTVRTDQNGNYTITSEPNKELIPGNYTLTYTWGDKTYTVQEYKGTIWTKQNRNDKEQNGVNWYKVNTDTRYSDAMDNWETRQKIDKGEEITTMDSTTPAMALDLEINSVYSVVKDVDKFIPEGYQIINIDFGIVERARQQLDIVKRVKSFKISLENEQVIVDATVEYDEKGNSKLVGTTNNVIYMMPGTSNPVNGQLWLQLDNELIQGSKVQVGYEIIISNNSEKDYATQGYYFYGEDKNSLITIIPTGVYDYLDGMVIDPDRKEDNTEWEVISKEEYNNKYQSPTVIEKYFKDEIEKVIDDNGNAVDVYTWEISGAMTQMFYEEWMIAQTEGRTVRDEKLSNKTILHNANLEKEIEPGASNIVDLYTSTTLANSNEIYLNNNAEITEFKKNHEFGSRITPAKSSYIYRGQSIPITPPTGENNNIVLIITTGLVALVILGVGVFLIKKKTL